MTHPPAPWTLDADGDIQDATGKKIVDTRSSSKEVVGIITAAPEMLRLLERYRGVDIQILRRRGFLDRTEGEPEVPSFVEVNEVLKQAYGTRGPNRPPRVPPHLKEAWDRFTARQCDLPPEYVDYHRDLAERELVQIRESHPVVIRAQWHEEPEKTDTGTSYLTHGGMCAVLETTSETLLKLRWSHETCSFYVWSKRAGRPITDKDLD